MILPSQSRSTWGILAVLALLAAGFAVRLYDLTDQPIDFHPTRQLRGAIIARGMYYQMLPDADPSLQQKTAAFWRSTGQYEPSILEGLVAVTYLLVGGELIWIARVLNSLFWIIGGIALFVLARRMSLDRSGTSGQVTGNYPPLATVSALVSLAFYLLLPFGVIASRSFQPDPGMVMWLLLYACFIYRWSQDNRWKWAILTGLCGGLAVLTKAIAFYPVAGIGISLIIFYSGLNRAGLASTLKNPQPWGMAGLILAPSLVYSLLLGGERAAEYFQSWTVALSHLLLQPWFYMRWASLVQNLVTPVALVLAVVGLLLSRDRNLALLAGAWGGYLLYGLFFPYQMYSHNYYHLQMVALISISMVPSVNWIIIKAVRWKPVYRYSLALVTILAAFWFIWNSIVPLRSQDFRNEPDYWQEIASFLPDDGKIIALTQDYGYRLMYYGWKKVSLWPNRGEQSLNNLRGSQKEFSRMFERLTADKSYFLVTSFRQFEDQPELKRHLFENYPVFAEGSGYLIFLLKQKKTGIQLALQP